VTARYHLQPFTESETRAYVQHRLHVAGQRRPIFHPRAVRLLHRRARGIPRLINTISDRALLGAYASARSQVDAATIRLAAAEVLGPPARMRRWVPRRWRRSRCSRWPAPGQCWPRRGSGCCRRALSP